MILLLSTAICRRELVQALENETGEAVADTELSELKDKLRNALTGILLCSELALTVPAVPSDAAVKIRKVRELAESMRIYLEF